MPARSPYLSARDAPIPNKGTGAHAQMGRPLTARPGVVCEAIGWSSLIGYSFPRQSKPTPVRSEEDPAPDSSQPQDSPMELPLSPLEFTRRARRLYADREAVVDGELRLTYAQFFDRCDRWSAALQALGVAPGRPRRVHRAEHARAARVVLRRPAARRRARADQLPAHRRRLRLHHRPQRRARRLRPRRLPRRASTRSATGCPQVEHFVALEGGATSRLARLRSAARRRAARASSARRSAKTIC